jgi:hypothetical protein
MARLQGLTVICAVTLSRRVGVLTALGEPAEAERAAAESDALLEGLPPSQPLIYSAARKAICRLGHEPARMIEAVAAIAGPQLERIPPPSQCLPLLALTRAEIALGRIGQAARWVEQSAAVTERMPLPASPSASATSPSSSRAGAPTARSPRRCSCRRRPSRTTCPGSTPSSACAREPS